MFCALAASFEDGTRMLQGRCGEAAGRASVDLPIKGGQRPPITVAFDSKFTILFGGRAVQWQSTNTAFTKNTNTERKQEHEREQKRGFGTRT